MLTKAARLAGVAAMGLLVSAAQGSPINIDTFDLGSLNGYIFGTTSNAFHETVADTNQTLFGERSVVIDALSASGDGTANFMVPSGDRNGWTWASLPVPARAFSRYLQREMGSPGPPGNSTR